MSLIDTAIAPDEVTGDLLQLLYVPLSALTNLDEVLAQGNPKRHEIDKLRTSIMQNGFVDPAKWDSNLNGGNGGIIYGNGRTEALVSMLLDMKAGGQEPPRGIGIHEETDEWCIPVKFGVDAESETAAKRFIVDHNLLTASGLNVVDASVMFETEAYLGLLAELKKQDALPLTINEEDYLALVGASDEEDSGGNGDGEEEGDGRDPTEMELRDGLVEGSMWQLGRHRIYCGDSTDEGAIALLLEGRKPTFVWSDPPYGMRLDADFSGAKSRLDFALDKKALSGNRYDNVIGDHEDFDPSFFLKFLTAKEQFWWGADYYAERLINKNEGSWVVWDKRVEESMDAVYGSAFELCWSKNKHKREFVRIKWAGIFGMEKEDTRKRIHPNQKPVFLAETFFKKWGSVDDLIFDPFLGSGISIIAAEKLEGSRTVYGCEISDRYCEVILQRWERLTGQTAQLISSP